MQKNRANRLKDALTSGEFVITFEVIPGRGAKEPHQEKEFDEALKTWDTGLIHAISITDNPGGRPALLADAVGEEFSTKDMTVLVHFTIKDRNRNQLQSQLYALARDGVSNVLVMSGDYPAEGWSGGSRPVFDLDPVQALMMITDMNNGLVHYTPSGEHLEQPTHFFSGAVVNPFKYTEGEVMTQYAKFDRKVFAGADYVITQLGYDFRKMDELQRYCRDKGFTVPLIANVFVLTLGAARLMRRGSIAGCTISDELFAVLEEEAKAEDKGKAARLERAAQMVAVSKGMGFAGVHIGGMGLTAEAVANILKRADELQPQWRELAKLLCYGEPGGFYLYEKATDASPLSGSEDFNLNSDVLAPKTEKAGGSMIMRGYGLSRFFHHMVLTKDKGFYGVLKSIMDRKERKKGIHRNHGIEHLGKTMLYGCLDCGDCGLETCIYSCPMSYCPKSQRNGPCGGSMNGWCEVYPDQRYCIWYRAYHRLKKYGETDKLNLYITPPNDWDLYETSGWSNYTHERDNAAHRIMMDDENRKGE